MASDRGVTCPHCGASTPMPDDLTVPTFQCGFCRAVLETKAYAGAQVMTGDALGRHLERVMTDRAYAEKQMAAMREGERGGPVFEDENKEMRPHPCRHCGTQLLVPMNLRVHEVTCGGCGRTQPVADYESDRVRFEADMRRQVGDNEKLKQIRAEGVACPRCGGKNDVSDMGSVQITCRFCDHVILMSDHVDAGAVARERLKLTLQGMRDARREAEEDSRRNWRIGAAVVLVIAMIVGAIAAAASLVPPPT